jgi:hypothetical protein
VPLRLRLPVGGEDEAASMLDALLATDLDALTVPHPTPEGAQT